MIGNRDVRQTVGRLVETAGADRVAYLATTVGLVAAFVLGFEFIQVAQLTDGFDIGATVSLVRSEILVLTALAALGAGGLLLGRGDWSRAVVLVAVQFTGVVLVFCNVTAHYFHQATGSPFNWGIFGYGLKAMIEVPVLFMTEVPGTGWGWLAGTVGMVVVGPVVAARIVRHLRGFDEESRPERGPEIGAGAVLVGLGVVSGVVAAVPPSGGDWEVGVTREQGLHLMLTSFQQSVPVKPEDVEPRFDIEELRLESTDETERRNVVFIVLESVRASATTPYSPQRETTPYLDELADQSQLFEQAHAVVPHTSKALVAIHCAVPPRIVMEIVESDPGGSPGRCLPTLLADQGYRSLFVQSATEEFEDRRGLVANMGFDDFIPLEEMDPTGHEVANIFGVEDDVMLPYSRRWLERHGGDEPLMMTYLTVTPHHDYRAPKTYGRFDFHDDDLFNRYLNTVRYVDHFVENVIDQFRDLGLYDSTMFVVVGDHGEAFGEHRRRYQHDNIPWQQGLHVPLLIHDGSGDIESERVDETVNHLDLVPIVAEHLGFEDRGGDYPGRRISEIEEDRPTFFSCWYDQQCAGFVKRDMKYIHHYGNLPDEQFDLEADPDEQHNLLRDREISDEPIERIFHWIAAVDAAYDARRETLENRHVVDEAPEFDRSVEPRDGGTVRLNGYRWSELGSREEILEVGFEVRRKLDRDERVEWIVENGEDDPVRRVAMRGLYPSLFWEEGDVLVDRLFGLEGPATRSEPMRLWLEVDGERTGPVEIDR